MTMHTNWCKMFQWPKAVLKSFHDILGSVTGLSLIISHGLYCFLHIYIFFYHHQKYPLHVLVRIFCDIEGINIWGLKKKRTFVSLFLIRLHHLVCMKTPNWKPQFMSPPSSHHSWWGCCELLLSACRYRPASSVCLSADIIPRRDLFSCLT